MENSGRHIAARFNLAAQLVDRLGAAPAATALRVEVEAVRTRYALCTSHLFFRAATGESERLAVREEFLQIVASEDFLGELDYLVRRVRVEMGIASSAAKPRSGRRRAARLRRGETSEVKNLFDQYAGHAVDCAAKTVERSAAAHGARYGVCAECRAEMSVSADTSELVCPGCGVARSLIGTVFDDAQFYNQEGQKAKSGSFNPNRHFRFWMDRILAREPEEELGDKADPENTCGEKLLARLRAIVRRDGTILRLLSVSDVRAMLKELGRSSLNKNVPLIMRRLTGVGPPPLSEAVCQRVEKLFSKAIEIGERVRPPGRTNRNYYPYYIYKILDAILDDSDRESRRCLYYIYMQGQDTLDNNDREWDEICAELPEIDWTATDRTKAQRYRPF